MSDQTLPAALPPKLQQLLATMPDVDKVKLMQIAHHYRMDLDDPGFLPLLLTGQGIEALEKSRALLLAEAEKTGSFFLAKIVDASQQQREALDQYSRQLQERLKVVAGESEKKMQEALSAWAPRAFDEAVQAAVEKSVQGVTQASRVAAEQAAGGFGASVKHAAGQIEQAAAGAATALADFKAITLAATFFFGMTMGLVMSFSLLKRIL